tara:strand:+ start:1996 stop:2166 length:171 start_codon:yes stop_codon:yes gene_type:complete
MISNFLSKNYKRLCIFIKNNPIVFRISIGNFILFFLVALFKPREKVNSVLEYQVFF